MIARIHETQIPGAPLYPDLRDPLRLAYVAPLMLRGNGLYNMAFNDAHAIPNDASEPIPAVGTLGGALNWSTTVNESYLEIGDVPDVRFDVTHPCAIALYLTFRDHASSDVTMLSKWAISPNTARQLLFIMDRRSGATRFELVLNNGAHTIRPGTRFFDEDIPYLFCLSFANSAARVRGYDLRTGELTDEASGSGLTNASDLTEPIRLWGIEQSNPHRGLGYAAYAWHSELTDAQERLLAQDMLAPLRNEPHQQVVSGEAPEPPTFQPAWAYRAPAVGVGVGV